ncbi:type II toxin-antitoxin system RelE/ParE family toxin [Fulvivirga ligni]|uniref:type II toxin-antitoxin system RelE/ParE family toxin n=1 Tax=Fulvivirga ligni TaxID=2904246 RepID=UPI001F31D676|nr:type II toxin-antitoxin system RelE/ParE family toxin [Fulvivirga ligni]UII19595.1 type II toxin-antitoxin system RelE/ParE family toxin [Fulvivirga ligni]
MNQKKLKIIWDDEAKFALRHIYKYLKKRESADVARKVRNKIVSGVKKLNVFPEKFEQEPVLLQELGNYRYKVIWSYKIIYEVTKEAVYIVDIFHTSRNPSNIKGH